MQRLITTSRNASSNITLTINDTKGYVWNFVAVDGSPPYLDIIMNERSRRILPATGKALKRFWLFLKPPLTIKEAKKKGLGYLILIIIAYLIRDTILYIILPLTACEVIF